MKLFSRRIKGYLTIFLLAFVLSYLLINYVTLKKPKPSSLNDAGGSAGDSGEAVAEVKQKEANEKQEQKPAVEGQKDATPKRYYAVDGNGRASINREVIKCSATLEVEVVEWGHRLANFSYFLDSVPGRDADEVAGKGKQKQRHYYMVYAMESEPHSGGHETWHNADFYMWYNLDMSFPEPATYFDVHTFLPDLLAPPVLDFDKKSVGDLAPIAWVLSNCNAFNRREAYVKKLMSLMKVDSYGYCLRNKDTHTSQRMHGNVELFTKYKFVLAIENSNCQGYVTEKLVHAVASGSIPIVAGRDNKPNYLQFMPKNSYINVYDYKSVDELAEHLKKIESSREEYEKYTWFKRKHSYTREQLLKMTLAEQIKVARDIFDYESEREFFDGLVGREKSENKLCKVARYLDSTPADVVEAEIKKHRRDRPSTSEACLPHGNLATDFNL